MEGYIGCCSFYVLLDISATVALIGVKFCTMVHITSGQIFSPFGSGNSRGTPNLKFWPFDRKYLENGKLQCYMSKSEINIGSTTASGKCKSQGSSPPGVHPCMVGLCLDDLHCVIIFL